MRYAHHGIQHLQGFGFGQDCGKAFGLPRADRILARARHQQCQVHGLASGERQVLHLILRDDARHLALRDLDNRRSFRLAERSDVHRRSFKLEF